MENVCHRFGDLGGFRPFELTNLTGRGYTGPLCRDYFYIIIICLF
jgi:hypothetical protein